MIYQSSSKGVTVGIIVDTDFRIPPLTGVTYRLYYLSKAIQKNGLNVKIFICNRNVIEEKDIRKYHIDDSEVEIHIIPEKVFYNMNEMSDIIEDNTIDIMQVEDVQSAIIFSKVAMRLQIPLITELHDIEATLISYFGHQLKDIKETLRLTRVACDISTSLVCMTKFDNIELVNKIGIKQQKITLVPNPIDTKAFPYVGPSLSKRKIVFVGNMYYPPNANAAYAIAQKISKKIVEDFKSVSFELAGMVPNYLQRKLQSEQIKFVGPINNLTLFLSKATLALCPITEGSGMKVKILNYCAAGIPVITTSLGKSGFESIKSLIVEDNIKSYPKIIKSLLSNDRKLLSISKQIRKQVVQHYEMNIVVKKYLGCIGGL